MKHRSNSRDAVLSGLALAAMILCPGTIGVHVQAANPHSSTAFPALAHIVVTTTSDVEDFTGLQQLGDLPGPDGLVSLREAFTAANDTPGPQVIDFNIPTSDPGFDNVVFTIKPGPNGLPALTDHGTTIDGMTQTLFTGDTNPFGPEIVLDGDLTGNWAGITISASDNHVIQGLVIHSFIGSGIQFNEDETWTHPQNVRIVGCYIGTDETGSVAQGNQWQGITEIGSNNLIGGLDPADRNIISGNQMGGVILHGDQSRVQGNFIGTDRTGMDAVPNGFLGVATSRWGSQNLIGGRELAARNLISGNHGPGLSIDGSENRFEGNLIGTDLTGMEALPNTAFAVTLEGVNNALGGLEMGTGNVISGNANTAVLITGNDHHVEGNFIGTDIAGNNPMPNRGVGVALIYEASGNVVDSNLIAYNEGDGVAVSENAVRNKITRNMIYSNGMLGIDLVSGDPSTVTPNDPGDVDRGPNYLMNYPVLASAIAAPARLVVRGSIDTPNPQTVTIEFFANPASFGGGDPSGHGEGAIYIGSIRPNRQGMFTAALPAVAVGTTISATATDADGNTSEFAQNITAEANK